MPKAVRFHEIGGPENLKIEEVPARQPGLGEAKLRVEAVGLNRAESLYYRGQYMEKPELPSRIGYEAAGVVQAVGPDVDKSWVGRRAATVPGYSQNKYGVLAEEAIVPASALAAYPEKLSPAEAAPCGCSSSRRGARWHISASLHKVISSSSPRRRAAWGWLPSRL
ncbi:MAG: alcohol dehydrogenase catalytic domain-containing protein [Acidobacteriaceae bacterium]